MSPTFLSTTYDRGNEKPEIMRHDWKLALAFHQEKELINFFSTMRLF